MHAQPLISQRRTLTPLKASWLPPVTAPLERVAPWTQLTAVVHQSRGLVAAAAAAVAAAAVAAVVAFAGWVAAALGRGVAVAAVPAVLEPFVVAAAAAAVVSCLLQSPFQRCWLGRPAQVPASQQGRLHYRHGEAHSLACTLAKFDFHSHRRNPILIPTGRLHIT